CAAPIEMRNVDPSQPGAFFAAFARDKTSGILELTSNARVSYVRFDEGRYASGYFCDKPETTGIPKFLEGQFHAGADGQVPVLTAAVFPYVAVSTGDRKSTRLNSSHVAISYAVFCLKKKTNDTSPTASMRHRPSSASLH